MCGQDIPDFTNDVWELPAFKYGIIGLMSLRQAMMPIDKPVEVSHLKFLLDPSQTAFSVGSGARVDDNRDREDRDKRTGDKKRNNKKDKDHHKSRDKETEKRTGRIIPNMGETAVLAGTQRGHWWRNVGDLDVVVRSEFSIFSTELFKIPAQHYALQAGPIEVFISGPAKGLQRMPVQPRGWATVDATEVGGPKYLERVKSPRWRVIFQSGSARGDIVVRESFSLESQEVSVLTYGTLVEQAGPQELLEEAIIRMPICIPSSSSKEPTKLTVGWVTCDARAQGGPQFFEPVAEESAQRPPQPARQTVAKGPADEADHNRLWKAVNLEGDGIPLVTIPQPYAPGSDKTPPDDAVVRWLQDGEIVEQVGHSKKVRGYMVMPVRCKVGADGEATTSSEGWVTRRAADKSRSDESWFEEIVDAKTRERRRHRKQNGNDQDDDD